MRLIRAIQAVLLSITDHGCIHTAQGITEELVWGAQEPGQGWLRWEMRDCGGGCWDKWEPWVIITHLMAHPASSKMYIVPVSPWGHSHPHPYGAR